MDSTARNSDSTTRATGPADLALPLALVRELVPDSGTGTAARPAGAAGADAARNTRETRETRAARRRRATVRG